MSRAIKLYWMCKNCSGSKQKLFVGVHVDNKTWWTHDLNYHTKMFSCENLVIFMWRFYFPTEKATNKFFNVNKEIWRKLKVTETNRRWNWKINFFRALNRRHLLWAQQFKFFESCKIMRKILRNLQFI